MFELPKLPYALDALEPHLSKETLEYHYGKHHQAYVNNLNQLTKESPLANMKLTDVIMQSTGGIFNNAAQIWNHTFYWNCLTPKNTNEPTGHLADVIKKHFSSFEEFKKLFSQSATTLFGSGWVWLIKNKENGLEITNTSNASLPMKEGKTALLTCDVWEHAYYIDYRNARPNYLENFWRLVNWEFVASNL